MRHILPVLIFSLAVPAFALNNRSAVSVNGLDTNPCSVLSPCRSFNVAIAQTVAGGEVIALDSAGYGPFTVVTSISVSGAPGVHAAITITSSHAITVDAGTSDLVTLRNLVLIGVSGPFRGVQVTQAGEVRVLDFLVRDFDNTGIFSASGRLTVDASVVLDCNIGITVQGSTTVVEGVITNSLVENSTTTGVIVASAASAQITNCTIAGSGSNAMRVQSIIGSAALAAKAVVDSSTLTISPTAIATTAIGGNNSAVVYLSDCEISYTNVGISASGGATVKTYGNNRFSEVSTVGPLSPVSLQ